MSNSPAKPELWRLLATLALLFLLAFAIRLLYQRESIVDGNFRADAYKYTVAARNLWHHGIYSLDRQAEDGSPPKHRTDLRPGYSLFLVPFFSGSPNTIEFVERVGMTQAALGALTVVLTFLIARLCLAYAWSLLVGILTALSPHLIVMDSMILTESLFTFCTILGVLLFMASWKTHNSYLTFLAAAVLTLSFYVRAVNILLLPVLVLVYLLHEDRPGWAPRKIVLRQLAVSLLGFVLIVSSHQAFRHFTDGEAVSPEGVEYSSTSTVWTGLLTGAYPGFLEPGSNPPVHAYKNDDAFPGMQRDKSFALSVLGKRFLDRPASYLLWYLGGKQVFVWRWDNSYNDDVYIYPMRRTGFDANAFLWVIHRTMRLIHWPLYALTLFSILGYAAFRWSGHLGAGTRLYLVPVIVFVYYLGIWSTIAHLPRYSIPVRPISYVLAAGALSALALATTGMIRRGSLRAFLAALRSDQSSPGPSRMESPGPTPSGEPSIRGPVPDLRFLLASVVVLILVLALSASMVFCLDRLVGPGGERRQVNLMQEGMAALYDAKEPGRAACLFKQVLDWEPEHFGATYQFAVALERAGKRGESLMFWARVALPAEDIGDEKTLAKAMTRLEGGPRENR